MRTEEEAARCIEKLNGIVSLCTNATVSEVDTNADTPSLTLRNFTDETSESPTRSLKSHTPLHLASTWASSLITHHHLLAATRIVATTTDVVVLVATVEVDTAAVAVAIIKNAVTMIDAMTDVEVEDMMIVTGTPVAVPAVEDERETTMTDVVVVHQDATTIDTPTPQLLLWLQPTTTEIAMHLPEGTIRLLPEELTTGEVSKISFYQSFEQARWQHCNLLEWMKKKGTSLLTTGDTFFGLQQVFEILSGENSRLQRHIAFIL